MSSILPALLARDSPLMPLPRACISCVISSVSWYKLGKKKWPKMTNDQHLQFIPNRILVLQKARNTIHKVRCHHCATLWFAGREVQISIVPVPVLDIITTKQRYRTGNFKLESEPMMDLLILTNHNEGLVSIYNLKCLWADLHCMFVVHFIFSYESLTVKDNIRTK